MLWLLLLMPPPAAHAADAFTELWSECYDVHTAGFDERMESFRKLISLGKSWQDDVRFDAAAIDAVTDKTCKAWAASPNGDTYLKEFVKKYGDASGMAMSLEDEADNYLIANLEEWNRLQSEEVKTLESFPSGERNLKWEVNFPCSGAFSRTISHIRSETRAIREKLARLQKECPHAADGLTQAGTQERAAKASNAQGTGAPTGAVPQGRSPASGSDITGTERKEPRLQ